MIKGMTGFGSAQISSGKVKGVLEIKSQNHRYFDLVFYLPVGFSSVESRIRQVVAQHVTRGRIIVSFKIIDKPMQHLSFNKDAVKEYLKYAKVLKKEFDLENNLTLADLIKLPGVVQAKEILVTVDQVWPVLEKSLKKAVKSLAAMRVREGKSLAQDMNGILKRMQLQIKKIQSRAVAILKEKKKKITVEEFVSVQRSCDINEELTRLSHYIVEFKNLLSAKVSVGKKLDFVAQEMQRETNTIGSKLQERVVSNAVIALKSKIEKLREQSQNIE